MRSIFAVVLFSLGCGASTAARPPPVAPAPVTPQARATFDQALGAFNAHESAGRWSKDDCASVAAAFDEVRTPTANFDAAIALERCGDDARAAEHLEAALDADPNFHRARAQLAVVRYRRDGDADAAIASIQAAVQAEHFQDAAALVDLASIEMKRDREGDRDAAKANLQRALAVEDAYMPALDQLALYYLKTRHFEMGALVASQAMQKDPTYAPIHNTAGLLQNAMGKTNLAVLFFQRATELDPSLFEAQMNLAQANLSFHGFARAEAAFRRAVALRPNDYDAHLGLAVAIRGQLVNGSPARIPEVHAELDACKRLAPQRPDAFYNEAILAQEFETKTGDAKAALRKSITLMNEFKKRASGRSDYAVPLRRADERIEDANTALGFL